MHDRHGCKVNAAKGARVGSLCFETTHFRKVAEREVEVEGTEPAWGVGWCCVLSCFPDDDGLPRGEKRKGEGYGFLLMALTSTYKLNLAVIPSYDNWRVLGAHDLL